MPDSTQRRKGAKTQRVRGGTVEVRLREIAHARSGDKGSSGNVGVIAYTPAGFVFLKEHLTVDKVQAFFRPLGLSGVKRYELPNLGAFNFILEGALAGGGSRSLRLDAQGKALGQAILEMTLWVPEDRLEEFVRREESSNGTAAHHNKSRA